MKERPIIMSGDHPAKIQADLKTMTRRVIKLKGYDRKVWDSCVPHNGSEAEFLGEPYLKVPYDAETDNAGTRITCPYGQVGDRLWVRETHYRWGRWVKNGLTKTGKQAWTFKSLNREIAYLDNPPSMLIETNKSRNIPGWFKRPSIFMPRWASRILLEITEVRVERVQDIWQNDAIAEGCSLDFDMEHFGNYKDPVSKFASLWDSLYAKLGYGWAVNPWVFPISFKEIK